MAKEGLELQKGIEYLTSLIDSSVEKGDISTKPVPLKEFLYGRDYLRCPPLSEVQYDFVEALSDIYPGCKYDQAVAEWGKGSGKDFVCAISICRIVYLLECLKDPATFYKLKSGSKIEIINIAVNAEQANDVFFAQFKNLIEGSPYFQKLGYRQRGGRVTFPKRVIAISGHSEMEGLEGHNVMCAILDEIDAFKTEQELGHRQRRAKSAKFMYDRMRTSSQSRFPGIGKIACISFPRFFGSFIQQRRLLGLKEPKTFVSAPEGVPTWIANPLRTFEDFADEFKRDPEMANAMYACKPPMARDAYFKYEGFIFSSFCAKKDGYDIQLDESTNQPIREVEGYEPPTMLPNKSMPYHIHVDLGQKRDRAGFAMIGFNGERVVVQLMWGFEAPINGEIDFDEIVKFIEKIANQGFWVKSVTYDGWQSVQSLQQLRKRGIDASLLRVKKEQYDTLKDLINSNCIQGYFYKLVIEELLNLEVIKGNKIDHKQDGSKDVSDALAGATWKAVKGGMTVPEIVTISDDEDEDDMTNEEKLARFNSSVDSKVGRAMANMFTEVPIQ